MRRRQFLRTAGIGISALSVLSSFECSNRRSRPNIIIFLLDDLGWKDGGFMGNSFHETPNIDRLAKDGMVFTDAYSNAPNCAPTRASLLTGLYPSRHGIFTVNSSARGESRFRKLIPVPNKKTLEPKFTTMAASLKQAGYKTACIGKWHLGDDPINGPKAHGFDVNIGGNHTGHPASLFSPYNNAEMSDGPEGEYLTDRLTEEALTFIRAHRKEPFFLYLSHYAVHTPIQAKPVPLLFESGHLQREAAYWHFPVYLEAYEGMKSPWRTTPAGAIRMGNWKLIEFFEDGRLELYNLQEDIGEENNQLMVRSDIVKELHERLKKWRTDMQAPVPTTLNPEYDPQEVFKG